MPYRNKGVDLDLILNKISDGISVHDLEWRYIYANERIAEIVGLPVESIIGKSIWDLYPEFEHTEIGQLCERVKRTMQRDSASIYNPYLEKWYEIDIYPSSASITFIARDVTEREGMQGKIKAALTQLNLITNSLPALISYVDRDLKYQYVNKGYEEWFKLSSEEIVGRSIIDVIGQKGYENVKEYFAQAFSGKHVEFDRRMEYPNGLVKFIHVDYVPDFDSQGEVRGCVALVQDRTEQQEMIESRKQSDERLNIALKNIPLILSHNDLDLRYTWYTNPINEFEGAEIIGKRADEIMPADVARQLDEVKLEAMRELRMISKEITFEINREKHSFDIRTEPRFDTMGELVGTTTAALDTTAWRKNELRLELLASISEQLSATLVDESAIHNVVKLLIGEFADYCAVYEPDDEHARVIALAADDPQCEATMRELISSYAVKPDAGAGRVLRTGEPLFVSEITDEMMRAAAPDARQLELSQKADLRSMIVVPLETRGITIGAITFALHSGRRYSEQDLEFARMIGRRIAAAIDNAQLYQNALKEIEDRKRAETEKFDLAMALEIERERLSNILGSVPGVVYETRGEPGTPEYRIVFVSESIREWTGASPDMMVRDPKHWMANVPEEEIPGIIEQAKAIPADAPHGVISYKMRLKDGSTIDAESHFRTLHDRDGNRIGRCGVLMDVSDRKRTEREREALRLELDRERMRLQEIMDSIPGAVYETVGMPGSQDYKLAYISPYVEKMLGRKQEEIADDPLFWVHYCPKEYREEALEQIRSFPLYTDKGSFPFKWQHKNGRIFDVEAHFSTRRDENGNVAGRTGVVMDVTDRLQAQQELDERRNQLSRLMANIPGMAYRCLTEKGWPFEYVSSGCADFTGYPAEDFLISGDRRWFDLINPADLPEIDRIVEDAIERNLPIEVTYRIRHASGEERQVLDRAVVVRDENNEIVAFEGICIDITEIKRAQDAIMQANQAKDQFIAALSHELRTPLTPVLTCVEILKDDERIPKDLQPMMEIIERNIQLESRLIDDLLDLTRIIRGKVHLEKKTMDLHSLLLNAVDICSGRIREKQLDLQLELRAKQSMVHCDPARMQQVLWNLLQNAAKFTPREGTITVKTWNSAQDELYISIQDTGIGMEPAQISRIFNPFEQGTPNITKQYGGLGLGLAISQRIVDLHSGSINAFSEGRDHGATFTVTLPVAIMESLPTSTIVA